MGVDLRLQRAQLGLLQALLLPDLGIKQLTNPAHHDIEAHAHLGDLVHVILGDQGLQVVPGDGGGHIVELPDGKIDAPRDRPGGQDGENDRGSHQCEIEELPARKSLPHLLVLRAGPLDFKERVVLDDLLEHASHKADALQGGLVLGRRAAPFDLPPHLIDLLGQRLHGSEDAVQLDPGPG